MLIIRRKSLRILHVLPEGVKLNAAGQAHEARQAGNIQVVNLHRPEVPWSCRQDTAIPVSFTQTAPHYAAARLHSIHD